MAFDYINEAFKKLDLLEEQMFDTSLNGINQLSNFIENDNTDDIVRVIDPDATNETELQDSYVGKVIINCNVCHSHIFENKEDIVIEEDGVVNIDMSCPYCGEEEGFTIVGEIAPYTDATVSEENSADETAETSDSTESDLTEDIERMIQEEDSDENIPLNMSRATERVVKKSGADRQLDEDFKEVSITTEDQHMEMTSDETGKVTVTTEPIKSEETTTDTTDSSDSTEGNNEVIVPVSDETESDILNNNNVDDSSEEESSESEESTEPSEASEETNNTEEESSTDVDFEEVEEEGIDELGESYLRRVYENVEGFKTTNIAANDSALIVEGVIKFTSGSEKKTGFIFEAKDINSRGQLRFSGHNKHLSESKDAFSLIGRIDNKKLIVESLKYNYKVNDDSVRGVIRRK